MVDVLSLRLTLYLVGYIPDNSSWIENLLALYHLSGCFPLSACDEALHCMMLYETMNEGCCDPIIDGNLELSGEMMGLLPSTGDTYSKWHC